jgi:serine/threonine protein kinase
MEQFQRYTIKGKIGSGGMATVYLAEDTLLKRPVALKMLHPHLLDHQETIQRFKAEAQAIATLSHVNIIKVHDYGEGEGNRYLVMEYIDGLTLQALYEQHGALPNLVLVAVLGQVFAGLIAAHAKGICHRDIKASNIMIDREGRVVITDFGIAYLVNQESLTLTGMFVGSPSYISPEQAQGRKVTGKTDIFSAGIMAYQCLTGCMPFQGDNPLAVIQAIVEHIPEHPFVHDPQILTWVSDFVEQCLQKDEQSRPDAQTCLTRLQQRCAADGLNADQQRIVDYLANPEGYPRSECIELFESYRRNARTSFKKNRIAIALKSLNQARAFGELSKGELRIIHVARWTRYARYAAIGLAGALIVMLTALGISHYVQERTAQPAVAVTASPIEAIQSSAAASAPEGSGGAMSSFSPGDSLSQNGGRSAVRAETIDKPEVKPEFHTRSESKGTTSSPLGGSETAAVNLPASGYVRILTNPPWAQMIIDELDFGLSPRHDPLVLKAGMHRLVLRKQGYEDCQTTVSVMPSETLAVRLRLIPLATTAHADSVVRR